MLFLLPGNRHKGWGKTVSKASWLSLQSKNTCKQTTSYFHLKRQRKKKIQIIYSKHKVKSSSLRSFSLGRSCKRFADKSQLPALKPFPYET